MDTDNTQLADYRDEDEVKLTADQVMGENGDETK